MENKKNLPLKVVHLFFMVLGLCFCVHDLLGIKNVYTDTKFAVFAAFHTSAAIFALISGILYLTHGYKKNAAAYYKVYIMFLLVFDIFSTISGNLDDSYFMKFVWVINLVLLTILAVGKDLGKTKSFTLVGLILVGKIIVFIGMLKTFGSFDVNLVLGMVAQIVLIITTGLMVCGKYLDKESRGAK